MIRVKLSSRDFSVSLKLYKWFQQYRNVLPVIICNFLLVSVNIFISFKVLKLLKISNFWTCNVYFLKHKYGDGVYATKDVKTIRNYRYLWFVIFSQFRNKHGDTVFNFSIHSWTPYGSLKFVMLSYFIFDFFDCHFIMKNWARRKSRWISA